MILLNGSNIKKMFLDETLFDSVSFNVDSNDKIGFIGVNGAGKSTLFKIITGDMDYDEGEIFKNKGLRVGYLDQYSVNGSEKSIWEETLTVFADVIEMENQLDEIRFDIENNNGNIDELVKFHKEHGHIATMTAVSVGQRFGCLGIEDDLTISSFREKSDMDGSRINAGFMVLEPKIFDYIEGDSTVFEKAPLETVASMGELHTFITVSGSLWIHSEKKCSLKKCGQMELLLGRFGKKYGFIIL